MANSSSAFVAQPLEFIIIFFNPLKTALFFIFDFSEKIQHGCFTLPRILKQEASGIDPPISRSAVECSTTELRRLKTTTLIFQNVLFKTMLLALLIN